MRNLSNYKIYKIKIGFDGLRIYVCLFRKPTDWANIHASERIQVEIELAHTKRCKPIHTYQWRFHTFTHMRWQRVLDSVRGVCVCASSTNTDYGRRRCGKTNVGPGPVYRYSLNQFVCCLDFACTKMRIDYCTALRWRNYLNYVMD